MDKEICTVDQVIDTQMDPCHRIIDIKDHITKKMPVKINWTRHALSFRNNHLDDSQVIFAAGIFNNDCVEILILPRRQSADQQQQQQN